ncbi:MAG: ankyrin repeat domain-containing protein, partial [Lautropia sp.]|nr:ankyrin repeat domain-containing protein [Lautropia sp.]
MTRLAVQCLLAAGAISAAWSVSGQTPPGVAEAARYEGLHAAAYSGQAAVVKGLLERGAPIDARDLHGRAPLHVATFQRQHESIRMLVQAGADLNALENDRYDAVTIAAVANDEETLRLLLSLGASAALITSRYDGTALIAAAHLGHAGVVRQLIAAGAPLDHVNNLRWTRGVAHWSRLGEKGM